MLEIGLETTNINDLDVRIRRAISRKMTDLTRLMYDKVLENLSGKLLNKRSGQLISSIEYDRERISEGVIEGSVYVNPETPKAWALEKGGEREYPILPTKASVLAFYWEKAGQKVFLAGVTHPPSREFGYLRHALDDIEEMIPDRFSDLIWLIESGEGDE